MGALQYVSDLALSLQEDRRNSLRKRKIHACSVPDLAISEQAYDRSNCLNPRAPRHETLRAPFFLFGVVLRCRERWRARHRRLPSS